MKPIALSPEEIQKGLQKLDGWKCEDAQLMKTYKFGNFQTAISFIVAISYHSEAINHHPEITNIYGTVKIATTTHDIGNKISELDVTLALKIESTARQFGA